LRRDIGVQIEAGNQRQILADDFPHACQNFTFAVVEMFAHHRAVEVEIDGIDRAGRCTVRELPEIRAIGVKRARFVAYSLALQNGGFLYLDSDVIVLKPIHELVEHSRITGCYDDLSSVRIIEDKQHPWAGDPTLENRWFINSGVFFAPRGRREFFDELLARSQNDELWHRYGVLYDNSFLCAHFNLLGEMVEKRQRFGRKNRKGFYDYPEKGKGQKSLWPTLSSLQPKHLDPDTLDVEELKQRFLAVQAVEAARTVEDRVITDPREADVGSILGFGFAPFTGGTLSYIDFMGTKKFVELCRKLEAKYGSRFAPPKLLVEMAEKGETFYGRFPPKKQAAA